MLDVRQNSELTDIMPGTPCGNLLRRYWHPVALESEISDSSRMTRIKVFGENLLLIKNESGSYSLFAEQCPHRGASLYYGVPEDDCIRCSYHGWKFDAQGTCIEKPFEKHYAPSNLLASYPVVSKCGLLFAYLGPQVEQPLFPNWDILNRVDGRYRIECQDDISCNWLQVQENAADVTHTFYLHSKMFERLGIEDPSGFNLRMLKFGFQPFPWGILKSWLYEGPKEGWGNLLVFPNILRLMTQMHWRVPIDNVTTRIFWLTFLPGAGHGEVAEVVSQPKRVDENGRYTMATFMSQDAMAVETQGPVFDRSKERLGASDRGIVMFRHMLKDQIDVVRNGSRPIANMYSAPQGEHAVIDLREWMGGYIPMSCKPDPTFSGGQQRDHVFDHRHQEYEIG